MKVLVYPASMDVGGSQLNAVDLAAAVREHGHDVEVFGPPGPLFDRVRAHGMVGHEAPPVTRLRPSGPVRRALERVVAERSVDLVHAYEWPPLLEAVFGPQRTAGVPVVGTVMSMGVAPFIPRHVPLTVGTSLMARCERLRRPDVTMLEPPVDTVGDAPSEELALLGRGSTGVGEDDLLVVAVSRLAATLKLEGLHSAIGAVRVLARELRVTLVIAGDGPCRAQLQEHADVANAELGRQAVRLVGEVKDPRPLYAAADVAIGMGSSALRALAFARPLVVQGEAGFFRLAEPASWPQFLDTGWYGVGAGQPHGVPSLVAILRELAADRGRRDELGRVSREMVVERFGLDRAAARCDALYRRVREAGVRRRSTVRLAGDLVHATSHQARTIVDVRTGRGDGEDFNRLTAQTLVRVRTVVA